MFDTTIMKVGDNNVSFNAVSGTLIKSTEQSKFVRFHMNSNMAKYVFDENKPSLDGKHNSKEIVVLQAMLCGGDQFLVEFIIKPKTKEL